MERYEIKEEQGDIYIYDTYKKSRMGIVEAADLLNQLMSLEEKNELKKVVDSCEEKLSYKLLDKTLEIIMIPIMNIETDKLVKVVEDLSEGSEAHWACANLLRRAIYLKTLADMDGK